MFCSIFSSNYAESCSLGEIDETFISLVNYLEYGVLNTGDNSVNSSCHSVQNPALAALITSPMLAIWPMIPFPVIASVTSARMKPIIAARPFSCSENVVNPCGIFLFSSPAAMRRVALRDGATVTLCDEVKEDTARVGEVKRARTGAPEMKAIVLVC